MKWTVNRLEVHTLDRGRDPGLKTPLEETSLDPDPDPTQLSSMITTVLVDPGLEDADIVEKGPLHTPAVGVENTEMTTGM